MYLYIYIYLCVNIDPPFSPSLRLHTHLHVWNNMYICTYTSIYPQSLSLVFSESLISIALQIRVHTNEQMSLLWSLSFPLFHTHTYASHSCALKTPTIRRTLDIHLKKTKEKKTSPQNDGNLEKEIFCFLLMEICLSRFCILSWFSGVRESRQSLDCFLRTGKWRKSRDF